MATRVMIDRALSEPTQSPARLLVEFDVDAYTVGDTDGRETALWLAYQLVDGHGCDADPKTGRACTRPGHAADRRLLAETLDMLGLLPPPAEPVPVAAPQAGKPQPAPRRRSLIDELAWTAEAACKGEDIATFFGKEGERGESAAAREQRGKTICGWCAVREDCLDWAVAESEAGVWGGMNEDERKLERRRRRARQKAAEGRAA
jgi:WhiB family redox-sensing transcriptional regulator